jgi:Protein of unknown function (DUF3047)
MSSLFSVSRAMAWGLVYATLGACASFRAEDRPEFKQGSDQSTARKETLWDIASASPEEARAWQYRHFPGKQPTQFAYQPLDGRVAIKASSSRSASMLRKPLHLVPDDKGAMGAIRFSWKVPALIAGADMSQRDGDDAPVRLVLAFEGDRASFTPKNALLSELAQALTGEPMPYATLMYVWDAERAPGSVIINPRTDRIRKLVVESGPAYLGHWRSYERDIAADFRLAFGEAPSALVGLGLMTDTDNTGTMAEAWYGPVTLVRGAVDRLATSADSATEASSHPLFFLGE